MNAPLHHTYCERLNTLQGLHVTVSEDTPSLKPPGRTVSESAVVHPLEAEYSSSFAMLPLISLEALPHQARPQTH